MGQLLSWIRGPRDTPALQDVAVEQQVCPYLCTSLSACVCVYGIVWVEQLIGGIHVYLFFVVIS